MNHGNHHEMAMDMPTTFASSTKVTLFFSAWTTTSTTTYILTLAFLFALAFLNRFLAALRFQLEHQAPSESVPILAPPRARRRTIPKARLSPLPRYLGVSQDETENTTFFVSESVEERNEVDDAGTTSQRLRNVTVRCLPQWTANAPWSLRGDGGRALLEGLRAFIGYILMLAVMTFNTGILCTVIAGIVVGEMVLGRYSQGSPGAWKDGACHDG